MVSIALLDICFTQMLYHTKSHVAAYLIVPMSAHRLYRNLREKVVHFKGFLDKKDAINNLPSAMYLQMFTLNSVQYQRYIVPESFIPRRKCLTVDGEVTNKFIKVLNR